MLLVVERLLQFLLLLGGRGAAANAAAALQVHTDAMAAVDSVVARLHRPLEAHRPAA